MEKEKKMIRYFTDSLEISSVDPEGEQIKSKYLAWSFFNIGLRNDQTTKSIPKILASFLSNNVLF